MIGAEEFGASTALSRVQVFAVASWQIPSNPPPPKWRMVIDFSIIAALPDVATSPSLSSLYPLRSALPFFFVLSFLNVEYLK